LTLLSSASEPAASVPNADQSARIVNLGGNLPPRVPHVFDGVFRAAIEGILATGSLNDLVGAHLFLGSERDRAAGARFAARRLPEAPAPDRVVVANGTQSLLTMLLAGLVGRGGTLAIESLSYPTIQQFADMLGIHLCAIAMDGEGIRPDVYEAACRARRPAALYVMPTLQNPTTAIMSEARRREIAEISRRYGVAIIEDDIYSLLPQGVPAPLSAFAPELSWYVIGTAKSMAAALKVAYVVAPSAEAATARFWPGVRATYWMAAPMNAAVVSALIETGGADRVIDAVRDETRARQAMVAERLAGAKVRTTPECLHVWLELPESLPHGPFIAAVRQQGFLISPSETYAFGEAPPPNAVRFGVGAASDRATLGRALGAIAQIHDL